MLLPDALLRRWMDILNVFTILSKYIWWMNCKLQTDFGRSFLPFLFNVYVCTVLFFKVTRLSLVTPLSSSAGKARQLEAPRSFYSEYLIVLFNIRSITQSFSKIHKPGNNQRHHRITVWRLRQSTVKLVEQPKQTPWVNPVAILVPKKKKHLSLRTMKQQSLFYLLFESPQHEGNSNNHSNISIIKLPI